MVLAPHTTSLSKLMLKPGRWTVGSAATCSYRIVAEGVRPRHALLLCGSQTTLLKAWDANTWHNGQPVHGEVRLQPGDRVTVGTVEFSVESAGPFEVLAQLPDAPREVAARAQSAIATPPEPDGWDLERLRGQIQNLRDELSQRVSRRTTTVLSPLPIAAPQLDVERMSARVAELEQSADEARRRVEQTQQELAALRAEQARRDAEWQHDREQLLAESAERERAWQQQADAWAVEHEQWQDELLSLANARQQLATRFEQRQSELQTEALRWQSECEELRTNWQQQQAALVAEHTQLLEESLRQKDEVAQQDLQAATQYEQELAKQSQQVAAEREQIQATQLESKQVLAELLAERQRVAEERQQIEVDRQQIQAARLASEQTLVELSAERERVEAERQQIEVDRQQIQAARLESEQTLAESSVERQRIEDRTADALSKFEEYTRRMAEFETQQAQLTRDLQVLEHSRNWVQSDRRKLVEEKTQWQQQCADRQTECESWEAERLQQQLQRDEFEKARALWRDEHDAAQLLAAERERFAAERAAWMQQREQSEIERQANATQFAAAHAELQTQQQVLHDEQDRLQSLRADWDARAAEVQIERQAAEAELQTSSEDRRAWEDDRTAWEPDLSAVRDQQSTRAEEPLQSLTDDWSIGVDLTAPREMTVADPLIEPVAISDWPTDSVTRPLSEATPLDQVGASEDFAPAADWDSPSRASATDGFVNAEVPQAPAWESLAENSADSSQSEMETLDPALTALRAELAEKFQLPGLRNSRPEPLVVDEPVGEESVAGEPIVEEPVAEELVVEEPVVEEPVVEAPVAPPSSSSSNNTLESLAFTEDEPIDDSVSRYMQHLLARSNRSGEAGREQYQPVTTPKTGTPSPTAETTPVTSPNTVGEFKVIAECDSSDVESPSSAKLRALQEGPAHRQDKDAIRAATEKMRQVANQQTLNNVQVSNSYRLKRSIKIKSSLAAFAFVLSAGLLFLGYSYQSDFLVLGVCAAGLGVMTWVDLFIAIREARRRTSQLAGRKKKA